MSAEILMGVSGVGLFFFITGDGDNTQTEPDTIQGLVDNLDRIALTWSIAF